KKLINFLYAYRYGNLIVSFPSMGIQLHIIGHRPVNGESNEKLGVLLSRCRPMLAALSEALVVVSRSGDVLYANDAAARLFECSSEELLASEGRKLVRSGARDLEELFASGARRTCTLLHSEKGQFRAVLIPLELQEKTEAVALLLACQPDERFAYGEVSSTGHVPRLIDAVMESSYDGLWIIDREGRVIRLNRAAERIFGCTAREVVGSKLSGLVTAGYMDDEVSSEVFRRKTTVTIVHNTRLNKRVLSTGSPIFDSHGEVDIIIINDRDITELNRMSKDLDHSKALVDLYREELYGKRRRDPDSEHFLCKSKIMQGVYESALRVSQFDSTVLLHGESGVGKGFFAKLIHQKSPRSKGPFIRVDCGAIVGTLFESELFGYERGAFTGAVREGKPGLIEMAHKGTLFFDEIGEVPLIQQVKLLRFLDEKSLVRVGGSTEREVDTRVIAATNKNLAEEVEKNRFRQDLYYRLHVVSIQIPPLRGRKHDVLELIRFFMRKTGKRINVRKQIAREALDALVAYDYPGNVRELEHMVESLLVMTPGDVIGLQDLPARVRGSATAPSPPRAQQSPTLRRLMNREEARQIREAVEKYGSQRQAARILGINQSTISRKLRKLQ
ncbi:MAG: sigma 54-interacting transcriptional regulator, partial [Deltaproteobacteria bacterium]|nr:sigma 54-interacting transcriptional regulator [Deltaproteobacteria bacterium]